MKKASYILMALALVLGLSQCKKDKEDTKTTVLEGEEYAISLTLGADPDAKVDVYPFDGLDIAPVYYKVGDKIEVVYQGKKVGQITCGSTYNYDTSDPENYKIAAASFSGSVTVDPDDIDGSPLYFFFLGNQTQSDGATSFTVDLSDQTAELPVISYGASKEAFAANSGTTSYTIWNGYNNLGHHWLLNQCALVKFECENIYNMSANSYDNNPYAVYTTTQDITIYDMNNQLTINLDGISLENSNCTWSKNDGDVGAMKLHRLSTDTEGAARYAIVQPTTYSKTDVPVEVAFNPATDDYGMFGTFTLKGEVDLNDYFKSGDDGVSTNKAALDLVWHSGAFTVGHHPGASLGDTTSGSGIAPSDLLLDEASFGDFHYIVFSRGNLQYNNNQNTWRFAKHQYDFVGGGLGSLNNSYLGNVVLDENNSASPALSSGSSANRSDNEQIQYTGTYKGWIDLYGWGTGDDPMEARQENSYYADYHEWGKHPIYNDGTSETGLPLDAYDNPFWYAMGRDEWQWLIESRCSHTAGSRIGFATVNGVKGMILLPDRWNPGTQPTGCPAWEVAGTHLESSSWNTTYTEEQWKLMELHGAVFLPAAGYRGSTAFSLYCYDFDGGSGGLGGIGTDQNWGAYWSKTKATQVTNASCFYMRFGQGIPDDHVNAGYYMAPDNGNAVRLVHRVSSSKSLLNFPKKP